MEKTLNNRIQKACVAQVTQTDDTCFRCSIPPFDDTIISSKLITYSVILGKEP